MAGEAEAKVVADVTKVGSDVVLKMLEAMLKSMENTSDKIWDLMLNKDKKEVPEPKAGNVKTAELKAFCRQQGEELKTLNDVPKRNAKELVEKAKEQGITVALSKSEKSDEYMNISCKGKDLPEIEKIMTDIVKENMLKKEGEYSSFSVSEIKMSALREECLKSGIEADFIRQKDSIKCVYGNADKDKVADIMQNIDKIYDNKSFTIEENMTGSENEKGEKVEVYEYRIQNLQKGKEVSYSLENLLEKGDDEIKFDFIKHLDMSDIEANLIISKLENFLPPTAKEPFKNQGKNLEDKVNYMNRVNLKDNELTKNFELYCLNLKSDKTDNFVLVNADGKAVKLEQPKNKVANRKLLEDFGINDKAIQNAILDKYNIAVKIQNDKAQQYAKVKVSDKLDVDIERNNKEKFTCKFGNKEIEFSFSDRHRAIERLALVIQAEHYQKTGEKLNFADCAKVAEQCVGNAEKLSMYKLAETEPEKETLHFEIDRKIGNVFTVTLGEIQREYEFEPKENVLNLLKNDFNIDDEKALEIFEKAEEQNPIEEQILTENERNSDIDTPEIPTPETPDLDDFGDDFELE